MYNVQLFQSLVIVCTIIYHIINEWTINSQRNFFLTRIFKKLLLFGSYLVFF